MSPSRPVLGITMGDPAGAGPEIIVQALALPEVQAACRPLVIGDAGVIARAARIMNSSLQVSPVHSVAEARFQPETIDVLDLHDVDLEGLPWGKVNAMAGRAAYEAVAKSMELALAGEIDAIVTSALNKEALHLAGYDFPGHTEILATLSGVDSVTMMLVAGNFRVTHVSTHVSLRRAIELVKQQRILDVIRLTQEAVSRLGIPTPRIAVAGLNPHSSEGGLFGDEEALEITPAVEAARAQGLNVVGPIPPDTVFHRMKQGQFDAVVAMYHDQGHIPTKVLAFDEGVNVTLGLPIIRTSVDHGTAFDIAGKGIARPGSLVAAIMLAARMATGAAS